MTSVFDYTTILTPAACLILVAPLRLRVVWSRSAAVRSASLLQLAKLSITLLFVSVHLALVILDSTKLKPQDSGARLSPSILAFIAALFAALLSRWEHTRSLRPSYVLQTYLLTSLLGRLVHVYADWNDISSDSITALEVVLCPLTATFLAAESVRKTSILVDKKQYPPQALIGVFGQRLFLWLNRLFKLGYRTIFKLETLGRIDEQLSSSDDCRHLRLQWLKIRTQPTENMLIRALCRTLYLDLLFPIIPRLLLLGVTLAQPWLIQRLLKFTQEPNKSNREAVLLGSATAALYVCLAVFQSWYWQSVCRLQAKIRFCLITAIYEKTLRSRTHTSPLTLMNVDLEKALFGIRPIHEYWAATSSIIIALGLLYTQLGLCFLAPLILVMALATVSIMNGITIGPKQKAWLEATQARVTYISETLNSMKAIKLYGLVVPTISKGTELREKEVTAQKSIRRSLLLNTVISQTAFLAIALVTYCAFAIRTRISGQPLTNHNLFTSLAILKLISTPMLGAVQYIPNTLQSLAALRRIQTFLSCDDQHDQRLVLPQRPVVTDALYGPPRLSADDETVACLSEVSCGYAEGDTVFESVSCEFHKEQLHIVTGSMGSGKSTLLKALLGELDIAHGTVSTPSVIAYCDQNPWLWNATIEENIVGVHELDQAWLRYVLWACGLDQDMRHISVGSKIGEGGSSLSGGQRNRVSLARALYSRTKFVLLDDVLSGLDTRTEMLVFNTVLGPHGLLKANRCTTLLATNSKRWLSYADSVVICERGKETLQGHPDTLAERLGLPSVSQPLMDSDNSYASAKPCSPDMGRLLSSDKAINAPLRPDSEVYKQYFKSFGAYYTVLYFALLVTSVAAVQMQSVWLKWWAAAEVQNHTELMMQVLVFVAISCAAITCLALLLGYCLLSLLARSSLHLHARQWTALMRVTYVAWITQNVGGVINRFSQDIMIIDTQLAMAFINTAMQVCTSIASTVLLIVATPYVGAVVPFLCAVFWAIQRVYLRTSKQLRTIDLEAKAPLCAHFLQSASGLTTIQAFGWSEAYREKNTQLLRESQVPYYLLASVQNWLSLVLNLIVAGLATAVVSIAFNLDGLDSGYFGLALTGIMDIGFYFEVLVTSWTSLETSLGAVSRMNQFIHGLPEQPEGRVSPPPSWPEKGEIVIRDLTASYQQGFSVSPTLNNIKLHIKPGQKVAICGRTGSGKSSIISAIFGLLNVTSGCIIVDDENIESLESNALRSAIMLLTQDPYFIPGSIRDNLVLHGSHEVSDDLIISALERTGLKDKLFMTTGASPELLDQTLIPQDMLTKGEMQLFAIARALLSDSKILILDEPTSGLDPESDQLVQKVLWEHCSAGNRTMICIAHKLQSIIDFDTVVVVDAGRIVEMGSPSELAKSEVSMFAQLLSQSS